MPKEVTITLDSGFFLPKNGSSCEIGYYECEASASDITVTIDGVKAPGDAPLKLGSGNCTVQIHHKKADGTTKKEGVTVPVPFHDKLLHMKALYDDHIEVDRTKFDCILLFQSGQLGPEDVRKRKFNRFKKQSDKTLSSLSEETRELPPIAHDVSFRFTLADGESIELTRDGKPFWSSASLAVKNTLEMRISVDAQTTEKFFRDCFKVARDSYWMPNPQDPPPTCPAPPCDDGGGG